MLIERAREIVNKIRESVNVKAVYLFGSYAKGEQNESSDIDLCVFGKLKDKEKREIASYGSDFIDISFFEELPLYIKFRVLKEGRPLFVKDEKFLNAVKIQTLHDYLDFKQLIDKHIAKTLKNV